MGRVAHMTKKSQLCSVLLFAITTEICVIALFIAAAVIAACVKPSSSGAVREQLIAGGLVDDPLSEPWLELSVTDDLLLAVTRRGIPDMTTAGAVSLAVTIKGYEVNIQERRVERQGGEPVNCALFCIEGLAEERYHITYRRDGSEIAAVFTLHVRPGMRRSFER